MGSSEPIIDSLFTLMNSQTTWVQPEWDVCVNYGCESSNVCWWYTCVQPSISGLQGLLNICGDYTAKHKTLFDCNKTTILFCPKKYKQPAPSNVFLNGVHVQFSNYVKYLGVLLNASLKDDDDIQRQVKSLYCAENKLRSTFSQCSHAVNALYHTPIACQCSAGVTIVTNAAIATGPALLETPQSSWINLIYYIKIFFSLRSQYFA